MVDRDRPAAISDITDPNLIRVLIFINGRQVHVPLKSLLKDLQAEVDALDVRVTALEP